MHIPEFGYNGGPRNFAKNRRRKNITFVGTSKKTLMPLRATARRKEPHFVMQIKLPTLDSYPRTEFSSIRADFKGAIEKYPDLEEVLKTLLELQNLNGDIFKICQLWLSSGTTNYLKIEFEAKNQEEEIRARNFLTENFPLLETS